MTGLASVVIVAYQSADEIGELVRRVLEDPSVGEVVVVDNGTDGAADVAEAAGAVVRRRPDNPGFGTAQNEGVQAAASDRVLLLNPDAEMIDGALAAGLAALDADDGVAAVQGTIVNRGTGAPERSQGAELGPVHLWGRALHLRRLLGTGVGRRLARRAGLADHVDRVPTDPVDVEVLAATAVLVRRRAFEAVGGFDERYFLYGEDLDLCRRLRRAGFRLVALPVPWARHDSGGTSASWWAREVQWWRGTLGFAARWWSTGAWSLAMGAALVRWVALAATRPRSAPAAWRSVIAEPCRVRRREGPAAPPASRA